MFENVKDQLWDILEKKEISLIMIFDKNGDILWHKGRHIEGKSVHLALGFSRSMAQKAIKKGRVIQKQDVETVVFGDRLPESAVSLSVRSLLVIPVDKNFFLYVDSGTKEYFSQCDVEVFRVMGELLGRMIGGVMRNETCIKGICGDSKEIGAVRETVLKYSLEDEPVLLTGETGVGKSHVAELIHRWSGRKGNFVVAEVTSINENLFESTMFGHRKGAFTDAAADKTGLARVAHRGTLFIDEVSEIPISFQAKLLRFIETKKYRVLGDTEEQSADVRIVAASNKDLQESIENKEFREDLYYRLHVLEIDIPPLRKRRSDIKTFILQNLAYLKDKSIGEGFWETVLDYDWPGNMRELITVLKRAGILLDSPITGEKISNIIHKSGYQKSFTGAPGNGCEESLYEAFQQGKNFWEAVKAPFLNRDLNRQQVKAVIDDTLERAGGSYKEMLNIFNLDASEYGAFMNFLYRNQLN